MVLSGEVAANIGPSIHPSGSLDTLLEYLQTNPVLAQSRVAGGQVGAVHRLDGPSPNWKGWFDSRVCELAR